MPETSNYQKHVSANPLQRFLIDNFYKQLLKTIKPLKPKRILDVGCGEGFTLIKLKHAKVGEKLEGIDSSIEALGVGRKLYPKLDIKKGDIYKLPYKDNSFDLLICTEVLEHLKDPEKALLELLRVTNKYVLLSVPNEPFFMLANLLRGKYLRTFGNHPEHVNQWAPGTFKRFLRKNGLKISCMRRPFPWTMILARK
ncbi:MAG: class I SAM-dependent methyltransferase [Candidatus Levybacteria bacterium]|nr:class I SAM-dependent methyltransferase [Candidatus Levybacteria bacterium]